MNALFLILGILTWPFLEYGIHRYLGHLAKFNSEFKNQHGRHHVETQYFAPNYLKVVAAVPVSIVFTSVIGFLFGWSEGVSFTLGFVVMYTIYEWAHWCFHFRAPKTEFGLRLRKHHFAHHFHNAQMNHGVTMVFWDRVFKTYAPVAVVKVPRQFVLPWLLSKDGKSIDQKYAQDFEYR